MALGPAEESHHIPLAEGLACLCLVPADMDAFQLKTTGGHRTDTRGPRITTSERGGGACAKTKRTRLPRHTHTRTHAVDGATFFYVWKKLLVLAGI